MPLSALLYSVVLRYGSGCGSATLPNVSQPAPSRCVRTLHTYIHTHIMLGQRTFRKNLQSAAYLQPGAGMYGLGRDTRRAPLPRSYRQVPDPSCLAWNV